jgi:hypothetical protein
MTVQKKILELILRHPGTSKQKLSKDFDLSAYRLHRVFRQIERDLVDSVLIHHQENGVWIVKLDREKCLGMDWWDTSDGCCYRQCEKSPRFPDNRCYEHSDWESPEMVAFKRRLDFLVRPCEPSPFLLGQLTLTIIDDMIDRIRRISPETLKDEKNGQRFYSMLKSAKAVLKWKDMMRRRRTEQRIPPEFFERHRTAPGRRPDFGLKRFFLILEVAPNSTREEVIKAWRKLARQHHPDAEGGDEEKMKEVNDAKDRIFRIKRWD